jgi:3-methylcrotonyl-CoA carboxylase beta subunit
MVGKKYENEGIAKHGAKDGDGGRQRRSAQVHGHHRGLVWRGQLRHVWRAYQPRWLWMYPNARISVMGGEQAANVLLTVKLDQLAAKGQTMTEAEQAAFKQPILDKYAEESSAFYSTARLWDDGIIDPADTRTVLALALSAAYNAPIPDTKFGVFRM